MGGMEPPPFYFFIGYNAGFSGNCVALMGILYFKYYKLVSKEDQSKTLRATKFTILISIVAMTQFAFYIGYAVGFFRIREATTNGNISHVYFLLYATVCQSFLLKGFLKVYDRLYRTFDVSGVGIGFGWALCVHSAMIAFLRGSASDSVLETSLMVLTDVVLCLEPVRIILWSKYKKLNKIGVDSIIICDIKSVQVSTFCILEQFVEGVAPIIYTAATYILYHLPASSMLSGVRRTDFGREKIQDIDEWLQVQLLVIFAECMTSVVVWQILNKATGLDIFRGMIDVICEHGNFYSLAFGHTFSLVFLLGYIGLGTDTTFTFAWRN